MLKVVNGKSQGRTTLTPRLQRQTRNFSHSWISKYGVRRSWICTDICPTCGQPRQRVYRLHPFPMPQGYGRGQWLRRDCHCITEERAKERSTRQELLRAAYADPLPPALRNHSFSEFNVAPFNKEQYASCLAFARGFAKVQGGRGILLYGKSGTGKTHLACAIANMLKGKYRVAFAYVPTLLESMRVSNVSLEPLISADLLVLDDIGSERESQWTMERLLIIVNGRLNNQRPTIFTTNYDIEDLEKRVGMRTASRILGNNVQLLMHGPDYRLQRYKARS